MPHSNLEKQERRKRTRTRPFEFEAWKENVAPETFTDRIKVLIGREGGFDKLAGKAGLSPRVLRKYFDGESDPSRERTIALARAGGVSVEWLATGEGPMVREGAADAAGEQTTGGGSISAGMTLRDAPPTGAGYVALPRYAVRAAAGVGVPVVSEEIADFVYFKAEWLRRTLGLNPASLALIEAIGDSMSPTIDDGDLLLIDLGDGTFRGDGIYVLGMGDELQVKRLSRRLPTSLHVASDNPRYEPMLLSARDLEHVRIIGRVVWTGGRM